MSGSCLEALLDIQELSLDTPGCPDVVERPFRMSRSGQESLPDVQEWSGLRP